MENSAPKTKRSKFPTAFHSPYYYWSRHKEEANKTKAKEKTFLFRGGLTFT
jgi:hypothetical protein